MALFDLVGRQWALAVIWVLNDNGPLTFRQLQEKVEGISPASLNTRLKELQAAGLVQLVAGGYAVTDLGHQLYQALRPLGAFSQNWAEHFQR